MAVQTDRSTTATQPGTANEGGSPGPAIEAKLTFYLDDVAPGKGCLSFIPGSHLWPLHYNDLEKKIKERVLGYPMQEFPGRYDLPAGKGDVIVFHTRIWHSSWGGGANRRQMAWMMRTEIPSHAVGNRSNRRIPRWVRTKVVEEIRSPHLRPPVRNG